MAEEKGAEEPGAKVSEEAAAGPSVGQAPPDDAALSAVATLLEGGVTVSVSQDRPGKSGIPENGMLSLSNDGIQFTAEDTTAKATNTRKPRMFSKKGAKAKVTKTRSVSIHEVGVEHPTIGQEGTALCRVSIRGGEPGFSFSFACKDGATGLSSSQVTELAAIVMRKKFDLTPLDDYWLASNGSPEASNDCASFVEVNELLCSHQRVFGPPGVAVTFYCKKDNQTRGQPFDGYVHLPRGDRTLAFKAEHELAVDASKVRAVKLQQRRNIETRDVWTECVIEMKEDDEVTKAMRKSLDFVGDRVDYWSFVCKNGGPGLSSSEVTKFAALVIQDRFNLVPPQFATARRAHNTALFAKLLQRLDLADKCLGKFQATGIRFENLGVVTEDVLVEVGITDRVDQINIYGQIQSLFLGTRKCPGSFAELLEPLGLVDKYCEAFSETGMKLENLGIVTREDLAQVVGITDLGDQINILSHIERVCGRRPDYRDRL